MGIRAVALVVILSSCLLIPAAADSAGKNRKNSHGGGNRPLPNHAMIWDQKRVLVRDYTDEHLQSEIIDTIEDMNEILPKNAPQIKYSRQEEKSCSELLGENMWTATLAEYDKLVGREIIICEDTLPSSLFGQIIGVTVAWESNKPSVVICHEFMHALSWIGDAYDSVPNSCVHGRMSDPTEYDARHLRRMYRMYNRHGS
jgi:hypothetical protein